MATSSLQPSRDVTTYDDRMVHQAYYGGGAGGGGGRGGDDVMQQRACRDYPSTSSTLAYDVITSRASLESNGGDSRKPFSMTSHRSDIMRDYHLPSADVYGKAMGYGFGGVFNPYSLGDRDVAGLTGNSWN